MSHSGHPTSRDPRLEQHPAPVRTDLPRTVLLEIAVSLFVIALGVAIAWWLGG